MNKYIFVPLFSPLLLAVALPDLAAVDKLFAEKRYAEALKVLAEPLTDARKGRFLREGKLLAELKSPAFPAFHGYGEVNGRPYIAEELLEPGELPKGDSNCKFRLKFSCHV